MPRNRQDEPELSDRKKSRKKARLKQRKADKAISLAIQPSKAKKASKVTLFDNNCLSCRLFSKCEDKKKRFDYVCSKFKPLRKIKIEDAPVEVKAAPAKRKLIQITRVVDKISDAEESSNRFEKIVQQALEEFQTTQMPPDLKIDDRDLPLAKNIIEFCSKEFLNVDLFAKQVEVALHMCSDYCPKCSDMKYLKNIPINARLSQILERVQLLEHGKCKKCKGNRAEFYNKGLMKVPLELALLCGQRCVTGDTLLNTSKGIISFNDLEKLHPQSSGFSDYAGPEIVLENGAVVKPDKFYRSPKLEPIYKLTTFNGLEIKGRAVHPIKTHRGWVKLKNIKDNDCIPIHINQQIWSSKKLTFKSIYGLAQRLSKSYLKTVHIHKKRISCKYLNKGAIDADFATLLGFYIAEGSNNTITNHDKNVLNFCYDNLCKLYGKSHIEKYDTYVSIRYRSAQIHWNILVEDMKRKSAQKQIPKHIMQSPKHIVCAFLKGLYEGDGSASEDMVSYVSISNKLIKQISMLLGNLGIPHRIHKFMTWAANGTLNQLSKKAWQINIEGNFACSRFRDQINFFSERKNLQLVQVINKNIIDMPCFYNKFPEQIKKEFLEILVNINKDLQRYRCWSRNKHAFQMHKKFSIRSMFDINSEFGRIYSSNVALSKRRLESYYNIITNHYFYGMVKEKTKAKLDKFYRKYSVTDTYWVSVKSKKLLKKPKQTYDIRVPGFHRFMANGILNHNSGKTSISIILVAYTIHRYLKLQNASVVFGLLEEEILSSQLVALTFNQAKALLYDKLYNYLTKSPWFKAYHDLMNTYQLKFGTELFKVENTFTRYRHRKLFISPQGPDMRKLRGITAFCSACDEIGLFINSKGENNNNAIKINGEEIYTSMSNAFLTLRPIYRKLLREGNFSLPPPMLLNTSSPTSKKDMIVNLYKQSKNNPDIYGMHAATWEFNPTITREDLAGKFAANYAKALRDYGAVPPNSAAPFIDKMKQIKPLCNPNIINNLSYRPAMVELPSGVSKLTGRVLFGKQSTTIPHIMTFDAGEKFNSFAIVTGFFDEKLNLPIFDGFLEVIPTSETPISFTAMLDDIMTPIIEHMNVVFVASDRWQNIKFFSDIENQHGIETAAHSLKYGKFLQFKEDVDSASMGMPMPECKFNAIEALTGGDYPQSFLYKPVAHLISQMLTVQDAVKDVIKGAGLTDDLFRAQVLAHSYLTDPEYQDLFVGVENIVENKRALGQVMGLGAGFNAASGGYGNLGVVTSRNR